ncbi:hypothetical protein JCM12296A_48060 [Desulfosarcina cetonica]
MGKVVEAETGTPIEGAVVLIGFHTKSSSVGGWVWRFADAIETLTDAEGNFRFQPKRVTLFRGMSLWDKQCQISIFKPGYAAYPGSMRASYSSLEKKHSMFIPENEHIIYFLPKLMTLKERKDNLGDIEHPAGIANERMPNLRRLESEERVNVGLKPFSEKIWRTEE